MLLYHGTSEASLARILRHGLQPRPYEHSGNWADCPSHPDRVYLTTAYALYYAVSALPPEDEVQRAVIFEIDTDTLQEAKMLPDEDFIAQVLVGHGQAGGMELQQLTQTLDMYEYQHEWQKSLDYLGTVAYNDNIPRNAITRYALVPVDIPEIAYWSLDPTITLENYMILGKEYRALIQWCFGGPAPTTPSIATLRQLTQRERTEASADMIRFFLPELKNGEDPWDAAEKELAMWADSWARSFERIEIVDLAKA